MCAQSIPRHKDASADRHGGVDYKVGLPSKCQAAQYAQNFVSYRVDHRLANDHWSYQVQGNMV